MCSEKFGVNATIEIVTITVGKKICNNFGAEIVVTRFLAQIFPCTCLFVMVMEISSIGLGIIM